MPFKIKKKGDQFCVISQDSGKSHGCHPTRAQAQKQLTAININYYHPEKAKKRQK